MKGGARGGSPWAVTLATNFTHCTHGNCRVLEGPRSTSVALGSANAIAGIDIF